MWHAPWLPAQGFANARQVMPAVAQGVVLNHKLRSDRCPEAEGEGRGAIQLIIGEGANRSGRLSAVLAQEFERGGLGHFELLTGMSGIQLVDVLPGDVGDGACHWRWLGRAESP